MFWVDKFVQQIIKSGKYKPYHIDDMKTPSGRIHVGALRGVILHDLLFKALKEQGKKAVYTYCFNDMDPMDGFPNYLPLKFKQYMGWPLFKIPSPEPNYSSMAQCYGRQFTKVFNQLRAKPKIIWSSEYYQRGKFNGVIKAALDKVKAIRKLYKQISGYDKPKNWYPFQVICPKCGKIGTTLVTDWDGKQVSFECKKGLVKWAQGCGYKGKVSPFNGSGKLMWKVDWAAHWKVLGVTVEWAGKDHMSKGGSFDLSTAILKQVFQQPAPFGRLYEWFLTKGGAKMSSSKGVGVSVQEIGATLPPEILRFLFTKTDCRRAIIFDPHNNQSLHKLFDNYDAYQQEFYSNKKSDYGRAWQFSQVKPILAKNFFLPRFRDVVNYIQSPSVNIEKKFKKIKGSFLTSQEKKILQERIKYARIWLKNYAPKELVYQVSREIPVSASQLSADEKKYLLAVIDLLKQKKWTAEELQQELYNTAKSQKFPIKQAFQAIYLSLLDKNHGPKVAWLLLNEKKEFIINRFKQIQKLKQSKKVYYINF